MRKTLLKDAELRRSDDELDCTVCAVVGYSSEREGHPVDSLFDAHAGPGGTKWVSDRVDSTERIVLAFDRPQSISRMIYEAEEKECARTQEVHVEVSFDGERSYNRILVQEYTFSPGGATYQKEDLQLGVEHATHLRLTIVPNKGGSGRASLTSLRLFSR